jgi:hypothetical protein
VFVEFDVYKAELGQSAEKQNDKVDRVEAPTEDKYRQDIQAAIQAVGEEETMKAVGEVKAGIADPDALLAWFEEIKTPDEKNRDFDADQEQTGFVPDFQVDTEFAHAQDLPGDNMSDNDLFISTARRRALQHTEAEDFYDPSGPPGGGGGGDDKTERPLDVPLEPHPDMVPASGRPAKAAAKPAAAKPKAQPPPSTKPAAAPAPAPKKK